MILCDVQLYCSSCHHDGSRGHAVARGRRPVRNVTNWETPTRKFPTGDEGSATFLIPICSDHKHTRLRHPQDVLERKSSVGSSLLQFCNGRMSDTDIRTWPWPTRHGSYSGLNLRLTPAHFSLASCWLVVKVCGCDNGCVWEIGGAGGQPLSNQKRFCAF